METDLWGFRMLRQFPIMHFIIFHWSPLLCLGAGIMKYHEKKNWQLHTVSRNTKYYELHEKSMPLGVFHGFLDFPDLLTLLLIVKEIKKTLLNLPQGETSQHKREQRKPREPCFWSSCSVQLQQSWSMGGGSKGPEEPEKETAEPQRGELNPKHQESWLQAGERAQEMLALAALQEREWCEWQKAPPKMRWLWMRQLYLDLGLFIFLIIIYFVLQGRLEGVHQSNSQAGCAWPNWRKKKERKRNTKKKYI